ncbi:MAG: hypothetical protein Q8S26_09855 [Azonexus sp.]|nr:hypothetical protein [Azonexus sp.]
MAIQSVTSNASAYASASAQTSQSQQAQQAQQAQPVEKRESRPQERVELKEEAPKPVTNTQGQRTGTLINVIA